MKVSFHTTPLRSSIGRPSHQSAPISSRTVEMLILMPFSRLLKVGGSKENIAKLMVWPAASAPSKVIVKLFAVELGDAIGVRRRVI